MIMFETSLGGVTPQRITLDWEAWDDETQGKQQLTLFHGHYDQYQYDPLAMTCAENDPLVMVSLRHGTATASLGADSTWRTWIIKVAAEVMVSTHRVVIRLSSTWPDLEEFLKVAQANATLANL